MPLVSRHLMNSRIEKKAYDVFINSIKNNKSPEKLVYFLNDLLSKPEQIMLAKRVSIAFLVLEDKYTYEEISRILKVSYGTIAKIHTVLAINGSGYRETLGDIIVKKDFKNALSEFLDLITPTKKDLAGAEYRKPKIDARKSREEPL